MLDADWAGLSWVGFTGLLGAHDGRMVMGIGTRRAGGRCVVNRSRPFRSNPDTLCSLTWEVGTLNSSVERVSRLKSQKSM